MTAWRDGEAREIVLTYRKSEMRGSDGWRPIPSPEQIRRAVRRLLDQKRKEFRP